MPNDTVYISIVREPVSQFVSMFHHLRMDLAISLEDFTAKEPIPDALLSGLYGRNQQLFDFGLPERYLDDEAKIREKVRIVGAGGAMCGIWPVRDPFDRSKIRDIYPNDK